jgi:hypothetical protein
MEKVVLLDLDVSNIIRNSFLIAQNSAGHLEGRKAVFLFLCKDNENEREPYAKGYFPFLCFPVNLSQPQDSLL